MSVEPPDHPVNTSQDLHESRRKPRLDLQELHRKVLENEATMEKLKSAFALIANALNGSNDRSDGNHGSRNEYRTGGEIGNIGPNDNYEPANRPGRGRYNRNFNHSHNSNGYRRSQN